VKSFSSCASTSSPVRSTVYPATWPLGESTWSRLTAASTLSLLEEAMKTLAFPAKANLVTAKPIPEESPIMSTFMSCDGSHFG